MAAILGKIGPKIFVQKPWKLAFSYAKTCNFALNSPILPFCLNNEKQILEFS